ncbi:MFS transporter [Micromonospora sp. NPDC126480]|uniref:MFS transporter n=1 Tax=Micromonospora sp. NPDC126480 TaxID=3155312 RepID=UPI0033323A20
MGVALTGMRAFTVVWAGQFLSLLGSGLTAFALGVHVYRVTGSATTLSAVFALSLLPAIVVTPLTGALVDRWGTKRSLLVSNIANMVIALVLATLLFSGTFAIWHVYPIVAASSVVAALELPAFATLGPRLVAKEQLGRVNGMRMSAIATNEVLAPVAAGFLLVAVGLRGIVVLDLITFGLALLSVAIVPIPRDIDTDGQTAGRLTGLLVSFREGWRYVAAQPGLTALLLFLGAINLSAGFIDLLITPLVLSFASADELGMALSIGGVGMVLSGIAVTVTGGPRRRVRGILIGSLAMAVATIAGATRPNVALVAAAAFVFMGALGVVLATNQALWQSKVEPRLLGRVAALLNTASQIPQLIAYLLAGVLVDRVFDPAVGGEDVRSPGLAAVIGDGPGRGAALLMMIVGALIVVSVAVAAAAPRLRGLERELPDTVPERDETGRPVVADPA